LTRASRSRWFGVLALASALACRANHADSYVRGHGLSAADLPLQDRVRIYEDAIGGSFQVGDPSLYLLLDPRLLPREGGYGEGPPVSQATQNALLTSHIVQGTCVPTSGGATKVAHCEAPLAGYVVRFSDVLRMPGDTMKVYLYVQRFSTPTSTGIDRLRFERIYKVVKHGDAWDAVAEGRVDLTAQ
jgi:hypothetical protein